MGPESRSKARRTIMAVMTEAKVLLAPESLFTADLEKDPVVA